MPTLAQRALKIGSIDAPRVLNPCIIRERAGRCRPARDDNRDIDVPGGAVKRRNTRMCDVVACSGCTSRSPSRAHGARVDEKLLSASTSRPRYDL
jgi:hypothetical protein